MLNIVDLYYFSPTGGTKKASEYFCKAIAENIRENDLGKKKLHMPEGDLTVVAAPVFAGRIPAVAIEKLKLLHGKGKMVVTLAVYGVRAYDDALLELNNTMRECGFQVIASAALVAQHSMVPEVGTGRPNEQDALEIQNFAEKVLAKLASENCKACPENIPGNYPYKDGMKTAATPVSIAECNVCGVCAKICPTEAIEIANGTVKTKLDTCILCMACVAHCPQKARILPPAMQESMNQRLGALKEVQRENEFFL